MSALHEQIKRLAPVLIHPQPGSRRPADVMAYVRACALDSHDVVGLVVQNGSLHPGTPPPNGFDLGDWDSESASEFFLDARVGSSTEWISPARVEQLDKNLPSQHRVFAEYFPNALQALPPADVGLYSQALADMDLIVYHYFFLLDTDLCIEKKQHPVWTGMAVLRDRLSGKPLLAGFQQPSGTLENVYPWNELTLVGDRPLVEVALGSNALVPHGADKPGVDAVTKLIENISMEFGQPTDAPDAETPDEEWYKKHDGTALGWLIVAIALFAKWLGKKFSSKKKKKKPNDEGAPGTGTKIESPKINYLEEEPPSKAKCVPITASDLGNPLNHDPLDSIYLIRPTQDRWWFFTGYWGPYTPTPPVAWANPPKRSDLGGLMAKACSPIVETWT